MSFIIKNCPAIIDTTFKARMCYHTYATDCHKVENCLLKRIYEKAKKCQCSELLNEFEIEEVRK